jgi:hypothetical protein
MKKYTIDDIETSLKVSKRTAQRYIENIIIKENKKSTFLEDVLNLIISRHQNDNITTDDNNDLITEYFTEEEFKEFHKRLVEYPLLKKHIDKSESHLKDIKAELEYHKKAYEKQLEIHEKLISSIKEKEINERLILQNINQRNYIEAKEKGMD